MDRGTPLPRLVTGIVSSTAGFSIGVLTPLNLLLSLHLLQIAGSAAAAAFGLVTGMGALAALVSNPLAGRISDRTAARFGRRRVWILTGALGGTLALLAMLLTTQVWQVVLVWMLIQAVFNFQYAATWAAFAEQVPQERLGAVSGVVGLVLPLGPLLGLAAVVGFSGNLPAQWAIVAGLAAVGGVLGVVLLRDRPFRRGVDDEPMSLGLLLRSYWVNPRRHPAFGWAWIVRFLLTCAYASGVYSTFLLVERFGVAQDAVGGIQLTVTVLSVATLAVTSVGSGWVSDRLGRQKPFVVAAGVIAAAALVLMALAPSIGWFYVASIGIAAGTGLFLAVDTALCVRVLPSRRDDAGRDYAVINIANTLPQSFVPFIAPALLAIGGYTALYLFLAALGPLGAFAVRRIPEIGREDDPRFAPITR